MFAPKRLRTRVCPPLGDPTEVGALERPLAGCGSCIGGVKANLGHTEPAAGHLGLLVLAHACVHSASAVDAQLRTLNPLLAKPLLTLRAIASTQSRRLSMRRRLAFDPMMN